MNIAISNWSFNSLLVEGKITQLEMPAKARELGFDSVEFAALHLPDGQAPLAFAPALKAACDKAGVRVVNYAIHADFLDGSGGDWRAEVERLKDEVRTAKALGATLLRHDVVGWGFRGARGQGFDEILPRLADACREITKFAQGLGVRTSVENHGMFVQDSVRLERLAAAVNHANFGLVVDMGNFLCVDEPCEQAVGRLMPYAVHVHAKDFHVKAGTDTDPGAGWFRSRGGNYLRGAIIGHGQVPVAQCLGIVKRAGYDGDLAIEFEGLEDPIVGMKLGLENLRRFVATA